MPEDARGSFDPRARAGRDALRITHKRKTENTALSARLSNFRQRQAHARRRSPNLCTGSKSYSEREPTWVSGTASGSR